MATLTAGEINEIEREFADGISSAAVVSVFVGKGERFSEATLRKYVQLGLLPVSRRVGIRGRQRGSSGLYPVSVIRQVNEIKRALEQGATLEEIRLSRVALMGEVQALRRALEQAVGRFDEAVDGRDVPGRGSLKKRLEQSRRAMEREVNGLSKLALLVGQGGLRVPDEAAVRRPMK